MARFSDRTWIVSLAMVGLWIGFAEAQSEDLRGLPALGRDNPFASLMETPQRVLGTDMVPMSPVAGPNLVGPPPDLRLETVNLKFLTAETLAPALSKMVTPAGAVVANPQNNSVIVCDVPEQVDKILQEIRKADKTPRQVRVEVVLLDVSLNDENEIGINWDLMSNGLYDVTYRQNFTTSRLGSILSNDTSLGNATAFNSTGTGGDFSIISGSVRHVIHALQEKKDVQIIASPQALVVSGRTASLEAVEEIPYTQQTSSTEGSSAVASTAFKNVGVTLKVTATLTEEDHIFLAVNTEQNVRTGESSEGIPTVDTRKENTSLLLQDGQVVIMGGLRRKEKTRQTTQIPLLGDLPLIGPFFRSTNDVVHHSELVILLSPHIYQGEPVPDKVIRSYEELNQKALITGIPALADAEPKEAPQASETVTPEPGETAAPVVHIPKR